MTTLERMNPLDAWFLYAEEDGVNHTSHLYEDKLLRARLYTLEVDKRKEEQQKIEGEKKEIGFGSQIRSYVLQPYQLVKDLRTGHEVGDPSRILDGDLDEFIEAFLAQRARTTAD